MKKYILALLAASSLALLCPMPTLAQWDYGQNSIYNSAEARADIRRTRERIRARQNKGKKPTAKKAKSAQKKSKASTQVVKRAASAKKVAASPTKSVKRAPTPVKKVVAPLPHHDISLPFDTFQDFHLDDINGYTVTFTFTPTSGSAKPITKTYNYNAMKYRYAAEYNDIPPATYTVKAVAVYQGKKHPVYLGSEEGSSTNPHGGNFAPSIQLMVKPAKDAYGDMVIQGFPSTIYTRVIE